MSIPRRGFLRNGFYTALASSLPLSRLPLGLAWARRRGDLPSLAEFESAIGTWFTLANEGRRDGAAPARPRERPALRSREERPRIRGQGMFPARLLPGAGSAGALWSLAGRFGALPSARGPALPEWSYSFRHDRLGEFPLLVAPAGSDDDGPLYTAVVNHLVP
jgi:hypothetical protein